MDWDSITQTGARASGVEESTPRMAVCCKSRVLPQHTQPVAQILNPVLNPVYFARIAAFLFGLLDSVQVETSAPPRFLGCHPFSHVFLGFSFEVVAQLVIQLLLRLRPAKQRPQPQWNREQPMLRSHIQPPFRAATLTPL